MTTLFDANVTDIHGGDGIENAAYFEDVDFSEVTQIENGLNGYEVQDTVSLVETESREVVDILRSCKKWLTGTNFFVYCSHFLSAWGDRMWSFGVGLFLIEIAARSLQLTAIYGLSSSSSYLLFGAIVGDWVDKTPRLREMTSTLRRIDLGTKILAPIATGQIMTYLGLEYGAVFIGGWNLVTVFIEYYLIWKVYQTVPALRKKKGVAKCDDVPTVKTEEVELGTDVEGASDAVDNIKVSNDTGNNIQTENKGLEHNDSDNSAVEERSEEGSEKKDPEKPFSDLAPSNKNAQTESNDPVSKTNTAEIKKSGGCKFGKGFITLYKGWRTYLRYNVCNAGLGLAFLYMTVLGFDNITVGYAYSQHISESILGFLMAGAAIIGIIGTITYPMIRKRIGLERTGLFALSSQIACLVLCVVSVFMPGSPFDILYRTREHVDTKVNCTSAANVSSMSDYMLNDTNSLNVSLLYGSFANSSSCGEDSGSFNYTSIIMLMAGIITARFGLWTADLAITQLFLETVEEEERGKVNGVQQSLNRLMDLLKFAMVVAAPDPQLFGVLVFISFAFVCLGAVLYASYSRRARGHLFHFDKIVKCTNNNHQIPTDNPKV
ncbi:hypothetical protein LOTGIDRAFT_171641 [Lottia gigantea]|uniref:Solute carrier family 40 member n=1 Tax=Lottia gigantea TaxID=225164 RepID=V4B6M4_LOTGI|nr:hypothetical protein LOTGIDRAFT_171641 [Lottia gigantea]ESP03171.1 hypothetical protein LOTGIDRAFT_171641 [Lottia gigantea]